MASQINLEQAKAFLMKDQNGTSLYDHLANVVAKIVADKPENALQAFEDVSRFVKQNAFKAQSVKEDSDVNKAHSVKVDHQKAFSDRCRALLAPPAEGEDSEAPAACTVSDLLDEANMFEWAGVGLSKEDSYRLLLSIKTLLVPKAAAKSIRFWGKITGTQKDYFVAEASIDGAGEANPEAPEVEPRGVGVNKFVYWVCNNIGDEWQELPDVSPKLINLSRRIKRLFVGNLEAPVVTHPYFPGQEKHLLRCVIARITAGTVVCPKGLFKMQESEDGEVSTTEIEEDAEFPGATPSALASAENWVHLQPAILLCGRHSHVPVEGEDEEQVEEAKAKQLEEDPLVPLLNPLNEDAPVGTLELSWAVRSYGDRASYSVGDKTLCYAISVARSLRWPGALCVAQGKKFANIYVGNGVKAGENSFFPVAPPDVLNEPEDPEEQPEPNPLELEEEEEGEENAEEAG